MLCLCRIMVFLSMLLAALPAGAGEPKLTIGLLPIADTLLLHVADHEGFFADNGLNVELVSFQSALEKDAAAQAGKLDGHFCEISSVIVQRAAGLPFVAVASTSHTNKKTRMFGLATSPQAAGLTLADFSGKSLATARRTIVDFLTDAMLAEEKLPEDYFVRRDIRKIPVRLQMLLAGQVDAALIPEPLLSIAEHGGGRVIWDDRVLDMPLAVIALRRDRADSRTVAAFRAALAQAARAVNRDPEKYRPLMLERRLIPPQLADGFIPPPFDLDKIPHTLPSPGLYGEYVRWLAKNGVLSGPGVASRPGAPPPPAYEDVVWPDAPAP